MYDLLTSERPTPRVIHPRCLPALTFKFFGAMESCIIHLYDTYSKKDLSCIYVCMQTNFNLLSPSLTVLPLSIQGISLSEFVYTHMK